MKNTLEVITKREVCAQKVMEVLTSPNCPEASSTPWIMQRNDDGVVFVSRLWLEIFNEQQINCGILNLRGQLMLCCYLKRLNSKTKILISSS